MVEQVYLVHGLACSECRRELSTAEVVSSDVQVRYYPDWPIPFTEGLCRQALFDPQCGGRLSIIDPKVGSGDCGAFWTCQVEPRENADRRWEEMRQ